MAAMLHLAIYVCCKFWIAASLQQIKIENAILFKTLFLSTFDQLICRLKSKPAKYVRTNELPPFRAINQSDAAHIKSAQKVLFEIFSSARRRRKNSC